MPSSATNSRTPQCVILSEFLLVSLKSMGYVMLSLPEKQTTYEIDIRDMIGNMYVQINACNLLSWSKADGGMITENMIFALVQ